uniref:Uncharacterized protein n=1 Tax=Thermococcus sp. AMT11 TaxID=563043 RepID=C8BNC0_9EURY|nr:unknown [Thermococcus sp. AMT11]
MKWKRWLVFGLVFLLVASVGAMIRAATISEKYTNAGQEFGLEFIPGVPVEVELTIVSSDGDPFTPSNFPTADSVTVTGKFVDDYGNAVDVTGDGNPDIYTFVEDNSTPGRWLANITVGNVTPGAYTLRIEAIAQNTTTGEILDNATIEHEVWIAGGKYWVLKADVKDGDEIKVGSLSIKIASLSDIGAILDLGNLSTRSITDDDEDGILVTKLDTNLDGVDDTWMLIQKASDDSKTYTVSFYSDDPNFLDQFNTTEDVKILSNSVERKNVVLKDHSNYKSYILWDTGLLSFFKATDYYIIPRQGYNYWKEGWGQANTEYVTVIKRTSYLGGLFGSEEKVFEGPIFNRNIKIDDVITLRGTWLHNMYNSQYRSIWEIARGLADIRFPKGDFELRTRDVKDLATTTSDEVWRGGHNPLVKPLRSLFGSELTKQDWEELLNFQVSDDDSDSS